MQAHFHRYLSTHLTSLKKDTTKYLGNTWTFAFVIRFAKILLIETVFKPF